MYDAAIQRRKMTNGEKNMKLMIFLSFRQLVQTVTHPVRLNHLR